MKPFRTISIMIILTLAIFVFDRQVLSWSLFNLFTDSTFNKDGLNTAMDFNPDKDILFLPPLNGKDLFQATRDLSICRNKAVRKYIYIYLTTGREYVKQGIERSYLYEESIKEAFKKYPDVPEEIAILPLLESCFNPHAVSSSKAMGLWQFVDNTSRPLGLQSNRWVEERRNIKKSTEAALRHLKNIRGCFPSWDLTLAAYNGGAGYVKRAMEKTGTADFWKLYESGQLRAETCEYVPRFIALVLIYKNQRLFGIHDEIKIPEKIETDMFTLEQPVDIKEVARLSGIQMQKIRELNPELNTTITPPDKNYALRMPAAGKKKLDEKAKELYKITIAAVRGHRVKKGETISKIAHMYKKKLN